MACLFPCVAGFLQSAFSTTKVRCVWSNLVVHTLNSVCGGTEAGGDWGQLELKIETQNFGCWFLFVCLLVFIDRVSLSRIHK